LEQGNDRLEEKDRLITIWAAARKALGIKRAHAGSVLGPLVLPEMLILPVHVDPISFHEIQSVTGTIVSKKRGDIGVSAGGIAVFNISPVAVIGPKTMDRPAILRTSRRMGVPELGLQ